MILLVQILCNPHFPVLLTKTNGAASRHTNRGGNWFAARAKDVNRLEHGASFSLQQNHTVGTNNIEVHEKES